MQVEIGRWGNVHPLSPSFRGKNSGHLDHPKNEKKEELLWSNSYISLIHSDEMLHAGDAIIFRNV